MFTKENFKRHVDLKTVAAAFIALWMALWIVFFLRENKDGEYREYVHLIGKDLEQKRAFLLGQEFYDFLKNASGKVPRSARYKFAGLPTFSILEIRGIYYLAPLKAVEEGYEYIFVYGEKGYNENGFVKHFEFNDNAYILKRT